MYVNERIAFGELRTRAGQICVEGASGGLERPRSRLALVRLRPPLFLLLLQTGLCLLRYLRAFLHKAQWQPTFKVLEEQKINNKLNLFNKMW